MKNEKPNDRVQLATIRKNKLEAESLIKEVLEDFSRNNGGLTIDNVALDHKANITAESSSQVLVRVKINISPDSI